jgi:hypothetical protein
LRWSLSARTGAGDDKAGNSISRSRARLSADREQLARRQRQQNLSLGDGAKIWERLAGEQERATNLRKKE